VFLQKLERIKQFEKTLADDGALILKFWMHISREVQEERLRALEEDPLQKWKLAADDWENWQHYDRFIETAELIISHTTSGHAPWIIVEGEDFNYRSLTVGEAFRDALEQQLTKMELSKQFATELNTRLEQGNDKKKDKHSVPQATLFDSLNLKHKLAKSSYNKKLTQQQSRLAGLYQTAIHQGLSTVLVFEGPDASGKGGAIRRVTEALDARTYSIHPVAAPTEEELAHHYLWRFWRHLPRSGRMTIFDRSWYGRVLVERLEGFATINEWQRAYAEINEFEDQLLQNGTVLLKFWLHMSKEEQARRFNARKEIPWKKWKLTDEDWRNHKKWREYEVAAHDMIQMTSMHAAPWKVIEGQDKYWGRIGILESVCDTLEKAIAKQT
jgi:polyphosphate:AMP phosphotransferase